MSILTPTDINYNNLVFASIAVLVLTDLSHIAVSPAIKLFVTIYTTPDFTSSAAKLLTIVLSPVSV